MADKHAVICVTGWYFHEDFYAQVSKVPGAEVFVVSHKARRLVPNYLFNYVPPTHVFFKANLGYDWGCYQQFVQKRVWREFEYVVFMHDDLVIKNADFLTPCITLLDTYKVVGNGRQMAERLDYPNTHAEAYAHSSWKPPSRQFRHDVVRGSFFATTRKSLEQLEKFEVFWDPFHLTSRFGNWSTRATCGKWEYLCGEKCFGFLSEKYCESDYLLELVRGGSGERGRTINSHKKLRWGNLIRDMCRLYMSVYWRERLVHSRNVVLTLMKPFILIASGGCR